MRKDWDNYFMDMAETAKTRSTCLRTHVGAVAVSENKNNISTGYNGSPPKCKHCEEIGCNRENSHGGKDYDKCRSLHAEQNALMGKNFEAHTIYITKEPCINCVKMIIREGIKRIVYKGRQPDELSLTLLAEVGIELCHYQEQYNITKTVYNFDSHSTYNFPLTIGREYTVIEECGNCIKIVNDLGQKILYSKDFFDKLETYIIKKV